MWLEMTPKKELLICLLLSAAMFDSLSGNLPKIHAISSLVRSPAHAAVSHVSPLLI